MTTLPVIWANAVTKILKNLTINDKILIFLVIYHLLYIFTYREKFK